MVATIGPSYIAEVFHIAKHQDPGALRILNEFGFETTNEFGDSPSARRRIFLKALDHMLANHFAERFHERRYRAFLGEIADRGLPILITEMDVLDDGLPANVRIRDRKVADVYNRYLDVTLAEPAVKSVMSFGLTDRYTWLQEDYPREDGAARRPLAYDEDLKPKPARRAIASSLRHARHRRRLWKAPRQHRHH